MAKTEIENQITKNTIKLTVLVILLPIIAIMPWLIGYLEPFCISQESDRIVCVLESFFFSIFLAILFLIADIVGIVKISRRLEYLKSIPKNKQKGAIYTAVKKPKK